ncbi:MAG: ABC transporter permease subunit [candidate division NC10 bacterium]|nr:ABC transporter permease subunit [candidate division NC10 bacterium]
MAIAREDVGGADRSLASHRFLDERVLLYPAMGLVFLLLLIFVFYPILQVIHRSVAGPDGLTLENYVRYFANPRISRTALHSLFVASLSTVLTVSLAFVFAYALTRTTIPAKGLLTTLAFLPLVAPSLVQALALIYLFGRNGLITARLLGVPWNIYGWHGIVLSEVFYCFPHALIILYTTLSAVDTRLDEAAQSLGAGAWRMFWSVTVPSAKYGLLSASFLVFNLVITDFGNPKVIGGDYNVLATEIYNQVSGQQNLSMGSTISVLLMVPAVLAFLLDFLIRQRDYALITGQARPFLKPSRPPTLWAYSSFCWLVCAGMLLVYATIITASFVRLWGYDFTPTLRHYRFESVGGYGVLWVSLKISAAAALAGGVLSLLVAYLVEKKRPAGARLLYLLAIIPAAIPGTVLGLAYIFAFNRPGVPFYGTMWILAICNVFHYFTLAVLAGIANLKQIDRSVEEAAVSLGAGVFMTFRRVLLPLTRVAFVSSAIYFFMTSMVTISAVIFLYAPDTKTAAIAVLLLDDAGDTGQAAAMSTLIIGVVLAALGALRLLLGKQGLRMIKA